MPKDTMISFRTKTQLNTELKKMAEENDSTLSGFINSILDEYLSSPEAQKILEQDRRRFSRQNEDIPTIVEQEDGDCLAARITSLSLGGISLAMAHSEDISEGFGTGGQFTAIFALPHVKRPVSIHCQISWVVRTPDAVLTGAVFHDAEPDSYQALLGYLC